MKNFILICFILICFLFLAHNTFAENWTSPSKLGTNQAFQMESECKRVTNEVCYDLGELPHSVYNIEKLMVDEKEVSIIVLDQAKKELYDADQLKKAALAADEVKMQIALKKIECGKKVIAALLVRNSLKTLTIAQITQENLTFANIKNLLETGSLETAKQAIQYVIEDGVVVTTEDKASLISTLDACK
jgi:hypothetical protein